MHLALRLTTRSAARCSYCRDALPDVALACPDCGTLVHESCQDELTACPTLGCGSLAAWTWVSSADWAEEPAPAIARARRRGLWPRWCMALVAPLVLLISSAPHAASRELQTAAPLSAPDPAAWFRFGLGARLVTRSERFEPGRILCGGWPSGDRESTPKRRPAQAWYRVHRGFVDSEYELVSRTADRVRVSVLTNQDRWQRGRRWLLVKRRRPAGSSDLREGELVGERSAEVTVPAGTFACTYRMELGRTEDDRPCVIETWSTPELPLPLKRVVTWRGADGPAHLPTTETTELVRIESRETVASAQRPRE